YPSKSAERGTKEELAAQFRRRALFGEQLQDDLGSERRCEGPSRPSCHHLLLPHRGAQRIHFPESPMKKIGIALSGGRFRRTLYHLGLVRFLRDAGLLRQVTHITSVSGGSIIAVHLALNWDLYTGSVEDFEKAASNLLAFTRLDVRNRIIRRFPLGLLLRGPRRLLGLTNRQLTRTGWLESYYEKHLLGDKSLFELPERPELHILATNLSKGCLCSFNRDGL